MVGTDVTGGGVRVGGLELDVPVVCAPMAGGPTTPDLVVAVSRAGGLGMLAGGYLTAEAFEPAVADVAARVGSAFGVNLFLPSPADLAPTQREALSAYRSRLEPVADRYGTELGEAAYFDEDIDAKVEMLARHRPALVTFTFGDPGAGLVERVHREVGAAVGVTVTDVEEARAAVAAGADLLVVQGAEAGGHRGIWVDDPADPAGAPLIPTVELVGQVADAVSVPIIAAGGIMSGRDIAAVLSAGAVAAQLGTAFLLTDEAGTSAVHRAAIADPGRREHADHHDGTVVTRAFSGRPARSLRNSFTADNPDAPAIYPQVHYLTKPLRAAAAKEGDADAVNLWAGTGWRAAAGGPAAQVIARLRAELLA